MFNVTVNTGPSQAFTVMVDRVPVAGDYITDDQGNAWLITIVYMHDGGGTDTGGKLQPSFQAGKVKSSARGKSAPR
jgi:hypothetical protein